jgi:hypothetical protein
MGRSGGQPGYTDRMALLASDAKHLVDLARERHPELPLFDARAQPRRAGGAPVRDSE